MNSKPWIEIYALIIMSDQSQILSFSSVVQGWCVVGVVRGGPQPKMKVLMTHASLVDIMHKMYWLSFLGRILQLIIALQLLALIV